MTLPEAVKILKEHNSWRRGDDSEMINPTQLGIAIAIDLGIAIDLIVSEYESKSSEYD